MCLIRNDSRNGQIEKMAWDKAGERLAVSFIGGDENHSGLIAVYDTRKVPILAVTLMYVLVWQVEQLFFHSAQLTLLSNLL